MLVWVVRPHRCSRAHCTGENFFRMRNSPKFARVLTIKRGVTLHQGLVRARSPLVEGGQARTRHSTSHHVCQLRTLQLGPPTATLTPCSASGAAPHLCHMRGTLEQGPHISLHVPPLLVHLPCTRTIAPASASFRQPPLSNRPAPAPPLLLLWKAAVEGLEPLAGSGRPRAVGGNADRLTTTALQRPEPALV